MVWKDEVNMDFKISSDFDYECMPEGLYDMDDDEFLAFLDKHKDDIGKLNDSIYLVFIREDTAFTFTVNDNDEIVNMHELAYRPKDYRFNDGLLLIIDDSYQAYYNKATLYRVTSDNVERLMEVDGE